LGSDGGKYLRYKHIKLEIEALTQEEDKRLELMLMKGGFNSWVIWVVAILTILTIVAIAYVASHTPTPYYY